MEIIKSTSHDGSHQLEFHEDKRTHLYYLDGVIRPGVTTVNKKGFPTPEKLLNWIRNNGRNSTKLASDAADIGKIVHTYAELSILGRPGDFDWEKVKAHKNKLLIEHCIKHFTNWWSKNSTRTLGSELLVASPEYKFCGTIDRLSLNMQDEVGIEDYKTSSGFFIDQFIQMAGYKIAAYEWLRYDVKWLRINLFSKKDADFHTLMVNQEGWYLDEKLWLADKFSMIKLQNQFISNLKTYNFVYEFEPMFDKIYEKLQENNAD